MLGFDGFRAGLCRTSLAHMLEFAVCIPRDLRRWESASLPPNAASAQTNGSSHRLALFWLPPLL